MNVRNMVKCALFAALMSICAWISIPVGNMVFTLQLFGIFLTLLVLGGKWGTLSVLLYLLLGLVGLPVFSGFKGGIGVLLGPTGGYLPGFLLCGLIFWLITAVKGSPILGLCAGLLGCYAVSCVWFCVLYGNITLWGAIGAYILPYMIPDGVKLAAAVFLARRLKRFS